MLETVDKLVSAISSGNILWLALVIPIAILVNFKHLQIIMETWEFKKKLGINRLTEANQCQQLDDDLKQFIERELQHEYFLYMTGISVGDGFRRKLLDTHQQTGRLLPFHHFRRALPYLKFEDDKLCVHISKWDAIGYYFNWLVVVVCLILFFLSFVSAILVFSNIVQMFAYGLFFIASAFLFSINNRPYWSAKKIEKLLDENK